MVAAGDEINAADLTSLEDYTIRKPLVRLVQQAAQSMTSSTAAAITFGSGSEEVDTHGFHDTTTNPSRITPTIAGWYRLTGTFNIVSGTSVTQLVGVFRRNGTTVAPLVPLRPDAASNAAQGIQITATVSVNGSSDYLEFWASQNSSGAINTNVTVGQQCVFECSFERPL